MATLVKDFFELDQGFTRRMLYNLQAYGLPYEMGPDYASSWRENPFILIAGDGDLWDKYTMLHPGQVTLTSYFRSLAICQFFIMNNLQGPEGDGALQMLRKHWYAWGKAGLQNASRRLGVGLMPNGEPDSEKLYDLMSRTFGDWNKDGTLEYRQIWILDNTTKMLLFEETLPSPFNGIIICCEKDAAFNGVALSAKAMGACAVYSGGGKSSRAGIEKLYYSRLKKIVERGNNIYVLVISDWDTDGESVIAPTFVEQLKTYIPDWQLQWTRVGITPEQIRRLGYEWQDKWYDLKWEVNGMTNYLTWSGEKAVISYECRGCGDYLVEVGATCPVCGETQVPLVEIQNGGGKAEKDALKAEFKEFFSKYTPHGFELDALTRVEYCDLLVEGLSELVNIDDICQALSDRAEPSASNAAYDVRRKLLDANGSYQEIEKYLRRLNTWFGQKTQELNNLRYQIENDAHDKARELVDERSNDGRIYEDDPVCYSDGLASHMRDAKFNEGHCDWCGVTTSKCYYPDSHRDRYWQKDAKDEEMLNGVTLFQPFSEEDRTNKLAAIVLEDFEEEINEFGEKEYEYEKVDIDLPDEE